MRTCRQCGREFEPKSDKQVDCSELCLANRFDCVANKNKRLARSFALTMGYRSMAEVRYASRLKHESIDFTYETDVLTYQYEPQKYCVDFTVPIGTNKKIFIEFKGKLDGATRRKMIAIKASNPTADIRFVFEKPNNKLYSGAKTRYWEWAEKHGFKWYDVRDIGPLKNEWQKSKAVKARRKVQPKGMAAPTPEQQTPHRSSRKRK